MKDYVYMIAGKCVSAVVQMLMLLLLASRADPDALALALAVYSLVAIVAALGDLGLGTLAAREAAYGTPACAISAIRTSNTILGAIALLFGLLLCLAERWIPGLMVTAPLAIWSCVERASETRLTQLVVLRQVGRVGALNGLRRVLGLLLFLVLLLMVNPILAFTSALAFASIIAHLVVCIWTTVDIRFSIGVARRVLRDALPFMGTAISGQARNLDVPIVAGVIGGISGSAFGLGSRLASPVMLVASAVSNLVLVRIGDMAVRKAASFLFGTVLVVYLAVAGLIVGRPVVFEILHFFIPWMTVDASVVVSFVAVSYMLAGCSIILGSTCVAFGRQVVLVFTNLTVTGVSLALIVYFVMFTGSATGAAICSASCYFAQSVFLLIVAIRLVRRGSGT